MAVVSGIVTAPLSVALYNADGSFRSPHYLVTIGLPAFGATAAKTLYLGAPAYLGPDGQYWEEGIAQVGQIAAGGSWLTSKWNPADLDLILLDKKITGQTVSQKLSNLFRTHEWIGASVLVQIAFDNTVSASDYRTIFKGRVEDWRDMDATGVLLYCAQDRNWSRLVPPNKINRTDFPYAPVDVYGVPRPIIIGDWDTGVSDLTGALGVGDVPWEAGVTRGGYPTVVVELESAAGALTSPKVLLSDKDLHTEPAGLLLYEPQLDTMAHSVSTFTVSGSGPVYGQMGDYQFRAPIVPIELKASTNTGLNAQELIRKDKDYALTGRAQLDYDASERVIELHMPDVSELGTFVGAFAYIWYCKPTTSGTHPQWGVKNSNTVNNLIAFNGGATSPASAETPADSALMNIGPVSAGGSGTVTGWSDIKDTTLFAEVRNAAEVMDIHRFTMTVLYKPQGRIVRPGVSRRDVNFDRFPRAGRPSQGVKMNPFDYSSSSQDVTSFDTPLYAYGKGVPDSGHASGAADGTYTGTAGALIENPVAIAHWALCELGGVPQDEIVTTSGEFGSFTDARDDFSAYKTVTQIAREQPVEAFLEELGQQFLFWFFRKTTDPKAPFVAIPWSNDAPQNYREASDLVDFNAVGSFVERGSFRASRTSQSSVVNTIRVNYDYDPRTRSYADQIYITPTESRVHFFGAFTDDPTREGTAATSQTRFGQRELTINLSMVRDPAVASLILLRIFDWRVNPRVEVRFTTFLNALDLERGHILRMGSDWDAYLNYPHAGGNGSWAGKDLQVFSVTKLRDLPVRYAVVAVET